MPDYDTDLISTKEAAALIGEGIRKTIRRVESKTLIPVKKFDGIRGAYVFRRKDVLELIKETPDDQPSEADPAGVSFALENSAS